MSEPDYIPRLPQASYPRWFVAQGSYVTMAGGKNLGSAYIVFAKDSAAAAWKDVVEPDILPGQALPRIATDSGGYAESVSADTGLNVAPDKIGEVTAAWLNRVASSTSNSMIKDEAGNLTDLKDEVFWRSGEGGPALDATDIHSMPADPVFALKTTIGGALVFYTTAAQLTLTPPDGGTISGLTIPGYYSPSSSAGPQPPSGTSSSSPPTSRPPGTVTGRSSPTPPASPPADRATRPRPRAPSR